MKRLLFLKLGSHFPVDDLLPKEKYLLLSKNFSGEIFAVVDRKELCHFVLGNIRMRGLLLPESIRDSPILRDIIYAFYTVIVSVYLHYFREKYDVIIASNPIATGPLAWIIGKLTRTKIIVEVNGNYESSFKFDTRSPGLVQRLKLIYSRVTIPLVLSHSDGVKLLYREQANFYTTFKDLNRGFVFADFVPISHFRPTDQTPERKYILFLGYPWFLKGVDILIKAFNKVCKEFPDFDLKIVGYCPDREEFEKLSSANGQIELCCPVFYEEVPKLMSECSLFVLPSRTEAMGRVLLEAMACKKPIVASNVDGIPSIVKDGKNGLLFEFENIDDLAMKMKTCLSNEAYSKELGENGYRYVHEQLSETNYLEYFTKMIESILSGGNG